MKTPVEKRKQLIETYSKESNEEIFSGMDLINYCIDQAIILTTKILCRDPIRNKKITT
jgi:hypothetical protein